MQDVSLFNAAGRLVSTRRERCEVRWHYEHQQVQRVEGCTDTHRFTRDARGRVLVTNGTSGGMGKHL